MQKRKILKKISLAGLAVVMATAGVFAFAPIGASASTPPPTTTTGLGLDPKNDPVVYTTESGLEIRMSRANSYSATKTLTSNYDIAYTQDLTGFYYFTLGTYSGTIYTARTATDNFTISNEPVNWIILGVGSHSNAFVESVSNYLFSTIKNNDYLFSNGEYYFDNQHETFSPAGQLIDSTISAKTYIMGKVKDSIKVHTEIPKGCMLVLSEKLLGHSAFNNSAIRDGYYTGYSDTKYVAGGTGPYGNRYRYYGNVVSATTGNQTWTISGNPGGTLYNYINNLFSKNTSGTILKNGLGFTQAQSDMIVPQQLYTYYSNGSGYDYQETPSTDGNTYYTMFPLADKNSVVYQNFCVEDYLYTTEQYLTGFIGSSLAYTWHTRSGLVNSGPQAITRHYLGGGFQYANVDGHYGVRPAMVMKLS